MYVRYAKTSNLEAIYSSVSHENDCTNAVNKKTDFQKIPKIYYVNPLLLTYRGHVSILNLQEQKIFTE